MILSKATLKPHQYKTWHILLILFFHLGDNSHRHTIQIVYSESFLEAFICIGNSQYCSDLVSDSFLKALLHLRVLGKAVKNKEQAAKGKGAKADSEIWKNSNNKK